ncbi:MAG: type VI secretion system tube protein Hcp [Desulfobacterales bacterium]|nr:type VI secretion system tube protein Hcp [Desulfobacterales bacterium]
MSTNMFLKLKGIDGEAEDEKHGKWIEILSWGHSFEQPVTPYRPSTGATVEKCKHELITTAKYLDSASAAILKAIWGGKLLDDAKIQCYRSDGNNVPILYLEIIMEDVIISTYSISGGEGDIPQEELGLSYGTISYSYKPMNKLTGAAGSPLLAKHNLVKNVVS